MNCLVIATTLVSFQLGHVNAESVIVMLCALHCEDTTFETELKSSILRINKLLQIDHCVFMKNKIQECTCAYLLSPLP